MLLSLNGKIIEKSEATIPVFHSGVYYGTGCFETVRAESGRLLFFEDHYSRLKSGLLYLGVNNSNIPGQDKLLNDAILLLKKNKLVQTASKVRIQCTLAEKKGYGFDESAKLYTLITGDKINHQTQPKKLAIADTRVIPKRCRPAALKLCNMLHYRNAYREAQKKFADDAVMLTINGSVSETSVANIFWRSNDKFYTPSINCDLLPGITRKYVIEVIENLIGDKVVLGEFDLDHLMNADHVWVTNSLMEIQSVKHISDRKFDVDSEILTALQNEYHFYKTEHSKP